MKIVLAYELYLTLKHVIRVTTFIHMDHLGEDVYCVRYRVEGIIRSGKADKLIGRAIPEEHDYPIANSFIRLTCPADVRPFESPTLDRNFFRINL